LLLLLLLLLLPLAAAGEAIVVPHSLVLGKKKPMLCCFQAISLWVNDFVSDSRGAWSGDPGLHTTPRHWRATGKSPIGTMRCYRNEQTSTISFLTPKQARTLVVVRLSHLPLLLDDDDTALVVITKMARNIKR
jgi:hypothetical protein